MSKLRRYCWRVGCAVELEQGEECPECGCDDHKPIPNQRWCGDFVDGRYCRLPIGHDGPCSGEEPN